MRNLTAALIATLTAASLYAAPAPYPVTINSRSQSAPPLPCFRANEHTFRVSFTDGGTASDVTGYIPFLNWSTNSGAAVVSTSSWAFVTATNGTVDFTFDPTAINYPEGRYVYNVGVKTSNGVVRSYSQGVLQIYGSPTASGASAVQWVANVDWNQIVWANLPAYALSADLANEAALRASGDAAGSNNVTAVRTELTNTISVTAAGASNYTLSVYAITTNLWQITSNTLAAGDAAGTNYTDAVALTKVSTNDTRYLATMTNGSPHSSLSGIEGAGTLHVTAAETNRIALALTNTPTLQQVVTAGGTVTSGTVTIDTLNATVIKAITSAGGTLQNSAGETCLTWGAGGKTVSTADGLMVHGVITGNGSGITNMTAAQVGAVSNTPAGIAAAGGIVTNTAINLGTNTLTAGGIAIGTNSSYANISVNATRSTSDWHAFEDWSTLNFADSSGYCSYDAKPKVYSSAVNDHNVSFQARPQIYGPGTNTEVKGFWAFANIDAAAHVGVYKGVSIASPTGGGSLGLDYGIYIEEQKAAGSSWNLYSAGGYNYFGGMVAIQTPKRRAALEVGSTIGSAVASTTTVAITTGNTYGSAAAPKHMNIDFIGGIDTVGPLARIGCVDTLANAYGGDLTFYTSSSDGQLDARMFISRLGNIGFGTTNLTGRIHAYGGDVYVTANTGSYTADSGQSIRFGQHGGGGAGSALDEARIFGFTQPGGGGSLAFFTSPSALAASTEKMRIDRDGNVGFGTNAPAAKLHVVGSAIIETNLTVNGLSYIILPSTAQTNGLASGILYNDAGTIKVMP
jgi:hypothetical protein